MEKMKWDKLSMRDRAFLIKLGIQNGITDLGEIRGLYEDSHKYSGNEDRKTSVLDKERIVRNIPAREWGPYMLDDNYNEVRGYGTVSIPNAIIHYLSNNKQAGKYNENLAKQIIEDFTNNYSNKDDNKFLDKNYNAYEDAIHYLDHVEGLRKYLGLPYDTSKIKESEYKPTRLLGTNEKTYKFSSSDNDRYHLAVEDMLLGGHKENTYTNETLNTFTAYRDRDSKGDFISIYDEWDYNPHVRGGSKFLNKLIDIPTGGTPFIIYDRVYLDDHYNIPDEHRGSFFIDPIIVTPENSHSFSGEEDLGILDGILGAFKREETPKDTRKTSGPVDLDEIRIRQAWAESRYDDNAKSRAGARGRFQIMPAVQADYIKAGGKKGDLHNAKYNTQVRDWYMDNLSGRTWITKGNATDSVRMGKQLAAYNAGPTKVLNALQRAKNDGVDIYDSFDWVSTKYLKPETVDYVNWILRNKTTGSHRNDAVYQENKHKYKK